jgi:hypothetical protein
VKVVRAAVLVIVVRVGNVVRVSTAVPVGRETRTDLSLARFLLGAPAHIFLFMPF